MSGQKSPSVNHLISFWSNPEGNNVSPEVNPLLGSSRPGGRRDSNARLRDASRPFTAAQTTSSVGGSRNSINTNPAAVASRFRGPQAVIDPSAPISPRTPSSPRSPATSTTGASAPLLARPPLLPLRSVAPAPTRLFGTQRHGIDTLRSPVRPGLLSSSSSQANLLPRNAVAHAGGPVRPNPRAASSPALARGTTTTTTTKTSSSSHQPAGSITTSAVVPSPTSSSTPSTLVSNIPQGRPSNNSAASVSVSEASGRRPSIPKINTRPVLPAGAGDSRGASSMSGSHGLDSTSTSSSSLMSSGRSSGVSAGLMPLRTVPPAPMKQPAAIETLKQQPTGQNG
ncbi:hypothetical protein BGW41_006222, partial [Actinomortierella wolfii]